MDYSQIPPEMLAKIMALGSHEDRQGLLQQQLMQAQASGGPSGRQYASPGGALFGGLADVVRQGAGAYKQAGIEKQQAGMLDERDQARQMYAKLLEQHGQEQAPQIPEMLQRPGYDAQAEFQKQHDYRGEQLAQLGMLTGDRAVGGMGQALMQRAEQRRQAPAKNLKMALDALKLKSEQSEAEQLDAPVGPEMRGMAAKFGVQLPDGMTNRQAKEIMDYGVRAYSAEQQAQTRQATVTNAEEDRIVARTEKLAKATEAAIPVVSSLKNLSGLLGEKGFDTAENIEGIGRGQNLLIGPLNEIRSEKAKQIRASAADLSANVLRVYSGAAASDREMMRTLERLGQGNFSSDQEFLDALKRTRAFISLQMKQSEAGLGQKAAKRLKDEGGVVSGDVETIGAPASDEGKIRIRLPSGATKVIPASKRDEAIAKFKATVIP